MARLLPCFAHELAPRREPTHTSLDRADRRLWVRNASDQSRILVDIRPQSYFDQRRRAAARVSVFAVLDRPLEQLLATRFASFRTVHLCTAGQLRAARFELVATGRRPHFTVRLPTAGDDELGALLAVLGPARDNPEYGKSTAQPGEA